MEGRGRGWLIIATSALSVAALVALGVFLADGSHQPDPSDSTDRPGGPTIAKRMAAYATPYDVTFSFRTTFPDDVTLSDTRLSAGGQETSADLWPLDGDDHEGEDLDPLVLPAGTAVLVEGRTLGRCLGDQDASGPTFSITATDSAGTGQVYSFSAANPTVVAPVIRQWCNRGPHVWASMETIHPDGRAEIGVTVVNPGPQAAIVEVPAYADEHVTWSALSGSVPAGASGHFLITGTEVGCEPGERASWEDGRLLVDGEPYVVDADDAWC